MNRIVRWAVVLLLPVFAAQAEGLDEVREFNIEAQPLDAALIEFSEQAGLQLMVPTELVTDLESPGVNGEVSANTALASLLDDNELTFQAIGDDTVALSRADGDKAPGKSRPASSLVLMAQNRTSAPQTQNSQTNPTNSNDDESRSVPLEEIIVTGTNLRGVTNPASPVITFDREDIDRSGQTRLPEFIQTIPQNFTGGWNDVTANVPGASEFGGNPVNGTGVNLRGLGSDATLILVNGRRMAPAGIGSYTDVSTIPMSAVERIEIVLDGASAIYGSDAVGGVMNIILRDEFEGAETAVRYDTVTDGERDSWQASQALGAKWRTGKIFANYEYSKQTPLKSTDRSFTASSNFPYDLSSDIDQHNVFLSLSQDLSPNTELFATANYGTRDTFANLASTFFVLSRDASVDQYGGLVGVEFDLPSSWVAEVSTAFNRHESTSITDIPLFNINQIRDFESEVWSWDARADGDLFELSGGAVNVAFGAGVRNEKFQTRSSTSATVVATDRDVLYVFGESLFPIIGLENSIPGVRLLEASIALRYEDFENIGSSSDGKLGLVWSPIQGLKIRGTYGTSFRAPLLEEAAPTTNSFLVQVAVDPESPTGSSVGILLGGNALALAAPEFGTPLKPEEAEMFTVGLDFAPESWPGFTASISYFDIDFTDRIAVPGASAADVLVNPAFAPLVTRNPSAAQFAELFAVSTRFTNFTDIPDDELANGGVGFIYDGREANIASTENSGIDIQVGYSRGVRSGELGISLSGTYLTNLEDRITSTSLPLDRVNTFGSPIDLRLRGALSWSTEKLNSSLFVTYADEYRDNTLIPEQSIDSFTTVDWTLSYEFQDAGASTLLNGVRLLFGAQNVFDEAPPFVDDTDGINASFDARNASPFGRLVSLQITKSW